MADNIQTPAGGSGDPAVATDEIGGAHYQKIKLALGAENEIDTLVDGGQQTMANSVPVAIASNQSPVPVDATPAIPAAHDYLPVRLTDGTNFVGGGTAAEDAPHASGAGGVFMLAVRDDGSTTWTDANGDYSPLAVDSVGRLKVSVGGTLGGTPKTEDAGHASGDTGFMMLAVRNDAGAALTDADGDYSPVAVDGAGRLRARARMEDGSGNALDSATAAPAGSERGLVVRNVPSGTQSVANAGAFAVQDSEKLTDNAAFADGASRVMLAGYVLDETAGTALSENDAAAARVDAKRAQVGVIEDGAARGTRLAIKGAATAPLAADAAAVVALSPNSYHRLATYAAVYRLASRPYALSHAFAANTRKQFATLHHAASASKTARIRRVQLALESASVAAIVVADLLFITAAPATGNPAIAPSPHNRGDAAAEATALALPTTAGTEGALIATVEYNLGVTGAASTINPPPALVWHNLYDSDGIAGDGAAKALVLRAGQLEGIAVVLDCSAAATVKALVRVVFTEE
jgi:hypothetical protein